MHCREVARELASPSAGADLAELQRHLATCGRCAGEAEAARRLDRVWTATRPAEPSATAWERLWTAVTDAPATIPLADARPSRRRWLAPAVGIALLGQAAAVILGVGLLLSRGGTAPARVEVGQVPAPAPATVPGQNMEFVVEEGHTLFLRLGEADGRIVCWPQNVSTEEMVVFDSEGVPPTDMAALYDFTMLNWAEGAE
jgi:hypothetical protein